MKKSECVYGASHLRVRRKAGGRVATACARKQSRQLFNKNRFVSGVVTSEDRKLNQTCHAWESLPRVRGGREGWMRSDLCKQAHRSSCMDIPLIQRWRWMVALFFSCVCLTHPLVLGFPDHVTLHLIPLRHRENAPTSSSSSSFFLPFSCETPTTLFLSSARELCASGDVVSRGEMLRRRHVDTLAALPMVREGDPTTGKRNLPKVPFFSVIPNLRTFARTTVSWSR